MDLLAPGSIVVVTQGAPMRVRARCGALTSWLTLRLRRPTTGAPLAWDASTTLRVRLGLLIDGVEHFAEGRTSGGIRLNRFGREAPEYRLGFRPTVLLGASGRAFIARSVPDAQGFYSGVPLTRIGETAKVSVEAYLEITLVSGAAAQLELLSAEWQEAPAPTRRTKNSVAFDAATDGQEVGGDGVMSITHTASGADRAAFAGNGNGAGTPQASTSITYASNGMTEKWDLGPIGTFFRCAGYTIAGDANVPTGAQTVTSTLAAAADEHALGVITATGVDSATPVGTAVTATGTASPASATVLNVGADDLIVDSIWIGDQDGNAVAPTAGADQTSQNAEVVNNGGAFEVLAQSTQPGVNGGVMSWSWSAFGSDAWGLGAIAFKPAAAGGDPEGGLIGGKLLGGGLLLGGVLVR